MEKLMKMLAAMMALLSVPPDQRDEKEIAKSLKAMEAELQSDGMKARADFDVKAFEAELEQLRKDFDAQAEELREVKRRKIAQPTGRMIRPGVPLMRFSHPDLAREFAHFCLDIKSIREGSAPKYNKDLTPVDDSEGGYLIPSAELASEISIMVEAVGVAGQIAGPVPMGAGGFNQVRRLGGATAYWKAAGAEGTESTPTFGRLDMKAETLICLVDVDLELDEDSMVSLGNYLASEFAYAIAYKEDQAAFIGDGSPTYGGITGILNSDRVTIVDMGSGDTGFANLSYDDLVDLEANVWEGALVNAQWLMHRTIKALVKKLKDTANMPIWQRTSGPEPDDLNGYPLQVASLMRSTADTAVSTTFLAFGDFRSGLKIGRRGGLRIDYSDEVAFKNFQRVWRAIERVDIQVNGFTSTEITAHSELANPIAVLKTAAS